MLMAEPVGLMLRDLAQHSGRLFGPTEPVRIDQAMVDAFAAATGDHQWPHVDVVRAAKEIGGTLVQGYFTLALIPLFMSRLICIGGVGHALNYGSNKVRFPAALRVGSLVTGSFRLTQVKERQDGLLMTCEHAMAAVGAERPACVAETMTLLMPGEGDFGPFVHL
jgi:acyl dehydratase